MAYNPALGFAAAMVIAGGVIILAVSLWYFYRFRHYLRATAAGAAVPLPDFLAISFRRGNVGEIMDAFIAANQAGLNLTLQELAQQARAGIAPMAFVEARKGAPSGSRG